MEQFTVRDLRRNAATPIAAIIRAGGIVSIVGQGFIIPASMAEELTATEPTHSLSLLYAYGKQGEDRVVVPARMSADQPIPIRFGTSAEVKAWMVPLSWGPRLGL